MKSKKEILCEVFEAYGDDLQFNITLNPSVSLIEQAMEAYFESEGAELAEWLFLWEMNSLNEWKHQNSNKIVKSTKELMQLFKTEKIKTNGKDI